MAKIKSKRSGVKLDDLIAGLRNRLGEKNAAIAEKLAEKYSADLLNLAYRLKPKPSLSRLSVYQQKTYEELLKVNPQHAEKWKAARLAERAEKLRKAKAIMDALVEDPAQKRASLNDKDVPDAGIVGSDGRGHAGAAAADDD